MIATMFFMAACSQPGGNDTGSEFMPDMGHSIAYEANYYNYYYNNTWGSREDYYKYAQPRLPVAGTVARRSSKTIAVPTAGDNTPYYYSDTEEERTRAMNDIIDNPHPITDAGLAQGKDLYNISCGICHGDKGDGNGYLVRDDGGAYPAQPANLIKEEFVNASNGRFYHSIMYGKNLMGSYKDKLSYGERWEVIHYIRSLQAKELKLEYNQYSNTLNNVDRPAGELKQMAQLNADTHHADDGHSHDSEHGHSHTKDHDDHNAGHDNDHHGDDHKDHHGDDHQHHEGGEHYEKDHHEGDHHEGEEHHDNH